MKRGAVFLDRDGTIIEDPGYLHDPAQVRLLDGAGEGLATMTRNGWPLVIVSNQSGIGRGLYGPADFEATQRQLAYLLEPFGVQFAGVYYCPHHPDAGCACRKPGVSLFRDAARLHDLDLGSSWFIGDRWRDVAPALELGGRGAIIHTDPLADDAIRAARHNLMVVRDLREAASVISVA